MSSIRSTLRKIGYSQDEIQGIVQLLLFPFGEEQENTLSHFNKMVIAYEQKAELDPREKNWVSSVLSLNIIHPDDFPEYWFDSSLWKEERIIEEILDFNFSGLTHLEIFKFLVALTQLHFFLNSRFKNFTGLTNQYELDAKISADQDTSNLIEKLGFLKSREYQIEDGNIQSIFLHAATEIALFPRLQLLKSISEQQNGEITVYYATNPRGLSINEKSTAEILAGWFTADDDLKTAIKEHLDSLFVEFRKSKLDWFSGLDKMRSIILGSINEKFSLNLSVFPSAPDNEVFDPAYEQAAQLERRDVLNNSWPHIGHLLQHLGNKIELDTNQVHFKVLHVCGTLVDSRYKPAQTFELVQAFFEKCEVSENRIYCISDNSVAFAANRQDLIFKLILDSLSLESRDVITYHDAANPQNLDLARIAKEIAATFYEQLPHFEKLLKSQKISEKYLNLEEALNNRDSENAKEIMQDLKKLGLSNDDLKQFMTSLVPEMPKGVFFKNKTQTEKFYTSIIDELEKSTNLSNKASPN